MAGEVSPRGRDGRSDATASERLARIARALNRPVADFDDRALIEQVRRDGEVLRLWRAIRTEAGRRRALDALRAVVRDETVPPRTGRA